jgi:hypothetical protein
VCDPSQIYRLEIMAFDMATPQRSNNCSVCYNLDSIYFDCFDTVACIAVAMQQLQEWQIYQGRFWATAE